MVADPRTRAVGSVCQFPEVLLLEVGRGLVVEEHYELRAAVLGHRALGTLRNVQMLGGVKVSRGGDAIAGLQWRVVIRFGSCRLLGHSPVPSSVRHPSAAVCGVAKASLADHPGGIGVDRSHSAVRRRVLSHVATG